LVFTEVPSLKRNGLGRAALLKPDTVSGVEQEPGIGVLEGLEEVEPGAEVEPTEVVGVADVDAGGAWAPGRHCLWN